MRSGCRRVISRRVKNDICRRSASFGRRRQLRAYAALLGTDGTMGFALVDLDEDGTPELICGEIDTQGQSEQIALTIIRSIHGKTIR